MMSLSNNIRSKREAMGLNQDEFAHRAGIPLRTFQNYESGKRSIPSDKLPTIAKALNCTVGNLYNESNKPNHASLTIQDAADVLSRLANLSQIRRQFVLAVIYDDPSMGPDDLDFPSGLLSGETD